MSKGSVRFIVLTGPPGCGKTTLVKKVCGDLTAKNVTLNGFFTEEVRRERERVGFDVILINGKRAPLARLQSENHKGPTVGKYVIDVESFESCALSVFSLEDHYFMLLKMNIAELRQNFDFVRHKEDEKEKSVLVMDEIGKMELLSKKFEEIVCKCISDNERIILATVPLKTPRLSSVVDIIKRHPATQLFNVTKENRNKLVDEITNLILAVTRNEV